MIEIDGAEGEGGGQIVRTSIALSVVTGKPVSIVNIREKRDKPGLRRQHLTAAAAAAKICRGSLECTGVGARSLTFRPKQVRAGDYHFDIGTAGSTTLVLQTILPGLLMAEGPSSVVLEGGTHNSGAPPFDFLSKAYLPRLRQMGAEVEATLDQPGFYPQGGGRLKIHVSPTKNLRGCRLEERGEVKSRNVRAILANLPQHIADREVIWIAIQDGWNADECSAERWDHARGQGNIVLIEITSENIVEVFAAFGQKGVRAEQVARIVWSEAEEYLKANVPVGTHLADQLLLPMSLAAASAQSSSFRTLPLTLHSTTHMQTLGRFLDVRFEADSWPDGSVLVKVDPA